MAFIATAIFMAAATLSFGPVHAAETVFYCDVVQDASGAAFPEVITMDSDTHVIVHLKRAWSDGKPSSFVVDEEQFVTVTQDRMAWGSRHTRTGIIGDAFTVNLKNGRYAWVDSVGTQIAHGACRRPAATS